jgi:uncharacterized membrane protein
MKTNRTVLLFFVVGIAAGAMLVLLGALFNDSVGKTWAGACFGAGAGLVGLCTSRLVISLVYRKHPDAALKIAVEEKDERNVAIREKADAQVNRILTFVLPAATLVFVLMNVELAVTLAMCGIVLLQAFLAIFFNIRYGKRM